MRVDCHESMTLRYTNLCREAINISAKAAVKNEVYDIALNGFQRLLKEVEIALKNVSLDVVGQIKEGENLQNCSSSSLPLLDPQIKKHKGRSKKLKSYLDKGKKINAKRTRKKLRIMPVEATNMSGRGSTRQMNTITQLSMSGANEPLDALR